MKYVVKAEFVDRHTGTRYFPAARGEEPVTFEPADDDQFKALVAARCIGDEPIGLSLFDKDVADLTRAELEMLALESAKAEIGRVSDEDLRAAIERYRDHLSASEEDDIEKLSVEKLKAVAAEEGVDLDGATKKADIIAAIKLKREAA
ncbi:hypothetical protein [Novosphingobium sp. fls2-241-R2A-195]|uniref:hypothetical protein n=1 Tax=Novosphingobium sp. fls2-241-R2A-195 TaxID=3040296 RepID=UPI0025507AC1|nr:hypothetical protein [Novosphingobium sp. fls2-241-R2A-195]